MTTKTKTKEPQEIQKFDPLKAEIAAFVAPARAIKVTDAASCDKAVESGKVVVAMLKRVDALRRTLVDPLNAQVKKINAHAKDVQEPLDEVEKHIRGELNRFAAEQEKIRQEEVRKAEEARRAREAELAAKQAEEKAALEEGLAIFGEDEEAVLELEEKQAEEKAVARIEAEQAAWDANQHQIKNTRKNAKLKVVDLSLVPREYLVLNEKGALAAMKAGVKIPGLELEFELAVALGSKTRVPKAMLEA
jgi:chemotaxis protein histidine kinase CheA